MPDPYVEWTRQQIDAAEGLLDEHVGDPEQRAQFAQGYATNAVAYALLAIVERLDALGDRIAESQHAIVECLDIITEQVTEIARRQGDAR